jgi:predicted ferric reductase
VIFAATTGISAFPWYVIRMSGLLGLGFMGLLMLSGIGQVTGLTYRFIEPLKAWAIHKAVALGLVAVIAVHVLAILIDSFMPFSLKQILVPFTSTYTNGTTLLGLSFAGWAVGLGVLAMYAVAIIVASSLGWIDSKKKLWHWLHYLSYFAMAATLLHAVTVGTEFKDGSWRLLLLAGTVIVALGVVSRLIRAGSLRRRQAAENKVQ